MRLPRVPAIILVLSAGTNAFPIGCDGLVGTWNWFTGTAVTFRADHTILTDRNRVGTWECADPASGTAKLRWNAGFIDTVTISGNRISGTNQQGVHISGTRRSAVAPSVQPPRSTSKTRTETTTPHAQPATAAGPLQTADTAPRDPRLASAWCTSDSNNFQSAIAFLNAAIGRNPRDAEAPYYRGRCWYYSKQLQQASQDLTSSLAIDPHNSWAYLYRGRVLERSGGNYTKVAADFSRAIEENPNNGDAYFARAVLYVQVYPSRGLDAYRDLSRTITLKPRYPEAHVVRAEIQLDYNQPQGAIADLDQAKALDPTYPDLDCRYGLAHWIAGDQQGGNQLLSRCYARDPGARPVWEREKQVRLQAAQQNAQRAAASGCHQGNWRDECQQELKAANPFPSQGAISNCVEQKWAACNFTVP